MSLYNSEDDDDDNYLEDSDEILKAEGQGVKDKDSFFGDSELFHEI